MTWQFLVVDDLYDNVNVLIQFFKANGIRCEFAQNGEDALRLLDEGYMPNLIITDLSMPKVNGWDLLKTIRANPAYAHIPVVALTAHFFEELEQDLGNAGFDAFFVKPVELNKIIDQLTPYIRE